MNVNRNQMIELLRKLIDELENGRGVKWKAQTTTHDTSYSVALQISEIALPIDDWPQLPAPAESDLFGEKK
jgi:hypothetical protein